MESSTESLPTEGGADGGWWWWWSGGFEDKRGWWVELASATPDMAKALAIPPVLPNPDLEPFLVFEVDERVGWGSEGGGGTKTDWRPGEGCSWWLDGWWIEAGREWVLLVLREMVESEADGNNEVDWLLRDREWGLRCWSGCGVPGERLDDDGGLILRWVEVGVGVVVVIEVWGIEVLGWDWWGVRDPLVFVDWDWWVWAEVGKGDEGVGGCELIIPLDEWWVLIAFKWISVGSWW